MENYQRDMEKGRLKKEVKEDLKTRWSLLLVNNTGKVYRISYLKALILIMVTCLILSIGALVITIAIASFSIENSDVLKSEIKQLENKNLFLNRENENLKARLALFDAAEKKEEKVNKTLVKEEKKEPLKPVVKKDNRAVKADQSLKKDLAQLVEIRDYSIAIEDGIVVVGFNILNKKADHHPVSGYIFAILKNREGGDKTSMVSPYSVLSKGKPALPSSGQYFSISRFKPVSIKFPGAKTLEKFHNVEILVYNDDNNLVLEKGFTINAKK